mmetsp:Transcript_31767/g.47475  ORF Transcript_31767/g.47475 Transcript_31767/m.47475 type:complete len:166 (-) Transcript_31767:388-885(-)
MPSFRAYIHSSFLLIKAGNCIEPRHKTGQAQQREALDLTKWPSSSYPRTTKTKRNRPAQTGGGRNNKKTKPRRQWYSQTADVTFCRRAMERLACNTVRLDFVRQGTVALIAAAGKPLGRPGRTGSPYQPACTGSTGLAGTGRWVQTQGQKELLRDDARPRSGEDP